MKKLSIAILFVLSIISIDVNAESFYTNKNGVEFTEREYSFISDFYFEGYQDYMTISDYEEFKNSNIINGDINIQKKHYYDFNTLIPYTSSSHETPSKILKLSSSCSSDCTINVTATWKKIPSTKSYDLIRAYYENISLKQLSSSKMYYGGNISLPIENNLKSNGFSSTFKIPNTSKTISISQTYKVSKGGRLYVSYQHAKNSVSLSESRKYEISKSGYGNVFKFDSSVMSKYDAMQGLNVYLN